jgi:hypothetical protein
MNLYFIVELGSPYLGRFAINVGLLDMLTSGPRVNNLRSYGLLEFLLFGELDFASADPGNLNYLLIMPLCKTRSEKQ